MGSNRLYVRKGKIYIQHLRFPRSPTSVLGKPNDAQLAVGPEFDSRSSYIYRGDPGSIPAVGVYDSNASIVQWLEFVPSKHEVRVRFPVDAYIYPR